MSQDNFDLLDAVPETQTGFKQIGKLSISTKLMLWHDRKLEEASRADFMAADKSQRAMDMIFHVDIQEFKTSLGFTYERKVRVGGLDWQKTLVPSIESVLGKGTMSEEKKNATIASLNGKYVAVMDVDEQLTKKQREDPSAKVYKTVKLLKVYASREEAYAESKAMGGGEGNGANGASAAANPNVPPDYTAETWAMCKDDLVKAVAEAVNSVKAPPKKAEAKIAAIAKFAQEYGASVEQVEKLLNS